MAYIYRQHPGLGNELETSIGIILEIRISCYQTQGFRAQGLFGRILWCASDLAGLFYVRQLSWVSSVFPASFRKVLI